MRIQTEPNIQIVMPVHNEAHCIRSVILEIYAELAPLVQAEFIICEDGSQDGTKEILQQLSREIPMLLITSDERKGYSRAMIDGLRASTSEFVACLDSDGQYTPKDFWALYRKRHQCDISIGWRKPRADLFYRILMSRAFGAIHALLFHVPVHDPSCGFLLIRRTALNEILDELGTLRHGFQWELTARAQRRGLRFQESPVRHLARHGGLTRVYHLRKLPRIASSHLLGLLRIWWETRKEPAGAPDHLRPGYPEAGHTAQVVHPFCDPSEAREGTESSYSRS